MDATVNTIVWISGIIIIIFAICGWKRGFVKMLIPILSWLFTIVLLMLLKDWLLAFLFQWAIFQGEYILARIVVVLLLYLLGRLALRWVFGALKILTKLPIIHGLNKILGLFAGIAEGLLIAWLLFYSIL